MSSSRSALFGVICQARALALLGLAAAVASAQPVGNDFESTADLAAVRATTPGVTLGLDSSPATVHAGHSSLRLSVTDPGGGTEIGPAMTVTLLQPIDLARYEAIDCWIHVPPELARYFFGRYDVRLTINGQKPLWSLPAIEPGWTHLRWDLRNLYTFPETRSLRLQLGPIMPGFGQGVLHVDHLVFVPMEPLAEADPAALARIASDRTAPWTHRFQAIRHLERTGALAALPALFQAAADGARDEGFNPTSVDVQPAYILGATEGSEAVRSAARATIAAIARRTDPAGQPGLHAELETALGAEDGRIRLAAIATVAGLAPTPAEGWSEPVLRRALLDDLYYVRAAALGGLGRRGVNETRVAVGLGRLLAAGGLTTRIAAARALSELGAPARPALPQILAVLRDPAADPLLRAWCLRAAWWTDEDGLRPEDWVVALGLRPGEVHRQLLNRAMDRLEKAGPGAIPALARAVRSANPEERARAALLLRRLDSAGRSALTPALKDPAWYVRYEAGEPVPAPKPVSDPVVVRQEGSLVFFSNGAIEVGFDRQGQDPGPAIVRFPGGPNLMDSRWLYRVLSFKDTKAQNILERPWLQKIRGVPLNKDLQWRLGPCTDGAAEMICRYPGGGRAPLDWELHYVLRRGDAGFYSYVVVRNVSGHELQDSETYNSANAIGMFNQLVAPTWGMFDTAVLHDNFKWPATFTAEPDFNGYPDIYQATYRLPNGEVDAKHEGGNHDLASPVTGYCGPHGGVWQILASQEFCGDSWPWDQKSDVNHNMFVLALENKYYVPVGVRISAGWEKVYGPIFYYFNRGQNTEEMWADAKRRATVEIARWPYDWLTTAGYQERGAVTGRLRIADGTPPGGAWALLALPGRDLPPDIEFGSWWRDVGAYHYCVPVRADGSFSIPHVRTGTYDLFIWRSGVLGETRRDDLTVSAGHTVDVGTVTLTPRSHGRLLWQIGEANRTVTEFRNGGDFHQWDTYLRYRDDFPFDVAFDVGRSDPARDWNYVQPAIVPGEAKPTTWTVAFDFNPALTGEPVLTVVAGGRGADMDVLINNTRVGELRINEIGLQIIRSVPYGELTVHEFRFPRALLHPGRNTLELTFARARGRTAEGTQALHRNWTSFIAYDLVRLEMEN